MRSRTGSLGGAVFVLAAMAVSAVAADGSSPREIRQRIDAVDKLQATGQPDAAAGVSFARDVAPFLVTTCGGCHVAGRKGDFQMATYTQLMNSAKVSPGMGSMSRLAEVILSGEMPPGGRKVAPDDVGQLIRWIDAGAACDADPNADLMAVAPGGHGAAAGRAEHLSHEQLTKVRNATAESLWRQFIPDEPPVVELRPGFALIGNLPAPRMEELAAAADEVAGRVRSELGVGDGPLLKGGLVIYAFKKSYDYSELWQVVLAAERPKGVTGHAGMAGDVAYGAFVLPSGDQAAEETRLLLAEQLTAAALAGRSVPAWFSGGVGRAVAARIAPKSPVARAWKRDAAGAVKEFAAATDFFTGRGDPLATVLVGGGFLGGLTSGGKLAQFVKAVDGGAAFDAAFQQAFKSTPAQALTAWAAKNAKR